MQKVSHKVPPVVPSRKPSQRGATRNVSVAARLILVHKSVNLYVSKRGNNIVHHCSRVGDM